MSETFSMFRLAHRASSHITLRRSNAYCRERPVGKREGGREGGREGERVGRREGGREGGRGRGEAKRGKEDEWE